MRYTILQEPNYKGYPISTDPLKGYYCITEIMDSFDEVMKYMLKYNKLYIAHIILRFPQDLYYPDDNSLLKNFLFYFSLIYKRNHIRMKYLWVYEKTNIDMHQHYHILLFYDGNKVQHTNKLRQLAERIWTHTLGVPGYGGLVHCDPSKHGIKVRDDRDDYYAAINNAYMVASYLSKLYSKQFIPPGVRLYGSSNCKDDVSALTPSSDYYDDNTPSELIDLDDSVSPSVNLNLSII